MNVPWGVSHDDIKLTQDLEIKVPQVTVDPLCFLDSLAIELLVLGVFDILILLDVVDKFAVGVMTGV